MNNRDSSWSASRIVLLFAAFCCGTLLQHYSTPLSAEPAANTADEVRARRLVVVDKDGHERIGLSCPNGDPGIAIYDVKGTKRATLTLLSNGSCQFIMSDDGGRPRAQIAAAASGAAGFNLYDENLTPRVHIELTRDGTSRLNLRDDKGHVRLDMSTVPTGSTEMKLCDANEEVRLVNAVQADGWPLIGVGSSKTPIL